MISPGALADVMEVKGIHIACDYEKGIMEYTLPQACLLRQYVRLKEGPIIRLDFWKMKKQGEHKDKLLAVSNPEIITSVLQYHLQVYAIPEQFRGQVKEMSGEHIAVLLGIEKDLILDTSIKKPRLGQYIHDYQKNIKKIIIDIAGEKNGLYTIKAAVNHNTCLREKNVSLPYLWEKDFKVFFTGKHKVYLEVKGSDKSVGIGGLDIEVI